MNVWVELVKCKLTSIDNMLKFQKKQTTPCILIGGDREGEIFSTYEELPFFELPSDYDIKAFRAVQASDKEKFEEVQAKGKDPLAQASFDIASPSPNPPPSEEPMVTQEDEGEPEPEVEPSPPSPPSSPLSASGDLLGAIIPEIVEVAPRTECTAEGLPTETTKSGKPINPYNTLIPKSR
uniref:Uncharacterized protein n=1 Tax=Chromera velia CCMP2878 TaxID=1169474 RepID=A0A0G4HP73_9ALVE|eukprot:Cvel_1204.t1-p1 / transcript=Cvel_1204.t1 / gene=Cvel_1204 / organism=Chromera_velia_CCMP2878 / gene_product=hypothetical protein / transcript_product=hypothetical protein / location=Cvel_scaffold40:36896-37613(+) / protein_length=179 / sequence_SO=supercontig / SO=protein_coding / is_pseudo=false